MWSCYTNSARLKGRRRSQHFLVSVRSEYLYAVRCIGLSPIWVTKVNLWGPKDQAKTAEHSCFLNAGQFTQLGHDKLP